MCVCGGGGGGGRYTQTISIHYSSLLLFRANNSGISYFKFEIPKNISQIFPFKISLRLATTNNWYQFLMNYGRQKLRY